MLHPVTPRYWLVAISIIILLSSRPWLYCRHVQILYSSVARRRGPTADVCPNNMRTYLIRFPFSARAGKTPKVGQVDIIGIVRFSRTTTTPAATSNVQFSAGREIYIKSYKYIRCRLYTSACVYTRITVYDKI